MLFAKGLPVWSNTGTDPGAAKKAAGWLKDEKPPAEWFNWLQYTTYKVLEELQNLSHLFYTDTGSANGIAITITEVTDLTQLVGVPISVATPNANTGAVTFTVNALAAKAVVKNGNVALATGDIVANSVIRVVYDGANVHLVSGNQVFPSLVTAAGDMLYGSAAGVLSRLAKAANDGAVMTQASGLPTWADNYNSVSASDTVILTAATEVTHSGADATKKSFTIETPGCYRIKYDYKDDGSYYILINGTQVDLFTEHYHAYKTRTYNTAYLPSGSIIEIKVYSASTAYVRNAYVCGTKAYVKDAVTLN
jgi:hypothetical protein